MVIDVLPTKIVHYPEPCLRENCPPFETIDDSVTALAERMIEIMHAGHGVGLAGPQVAVTRRIFVCSPTGQPDDNMIFINPELSDLTGAVEADEGCLSCPDITVAVRRARRCRIQALNLDGEKIEMEAEDLLARIWQHECDHLAGQLIIDRMNASDRIANKRAIAELEAKYRKTRRSR